MATITFQRATRTYAQTARPAVDALDLQVEDGELLVLVGPSGCGKSTSLRMLAGLEPVDSGEIHIDAQDVSGLPPKARDIAMVFQNYALYPHMTVGENMAFGLKMAGVSKSERRARVGEASRMLDLDGLLDRRPKQLSGGQRQRVAMGRAIVRHPQAFLMDEPLSNLDAKLRVQTRTQIAQLQRRLGVTTVYVTHDQVEAMTMGDRVAVMRDGVLQQCDTPLALYDRPTNAFVAGFIGSPAMNLIDLPIVGDCALLGEHRIRLPRAALAACHEERATVGFRPETVHPGPDGTEYVVDVVEELGADAYLYGRITAVPGSPTVVVRAPGRGAPPRGAAIRVAIDESAVHVFSTRSGERLN